MAKWKWAKDGQKRGGASPELFAAGDVYLDEPHEDMMFRWDKATRKWFKKFYGEDTESEVLPGAKLHFEAQLNGFVIDKAEYWTTKSPFPD